MSDKLSNPAVNGKESYQCTMCDPTFQDKNALSGHMAQHNGEKPHQDHLHLPNLNIKEEPMDYVEEQVKYDEEMQDETLLKCSYCEKVFNEESMLKSHIQQHDSERMLPCKTWNMMFTSATLLQSHMLIHENQGQGQADDDNNIACEKDDHVKNETDAKQLGLRENEEMKTIHECNVCKLIFEEKVELANHMLTHKSSELYTFSKNQPGQKPFTMKKVSTRNKMGVTDEKPYQCNLCGETFTDKPFLHIHMKTHSGSAKDKGFKCTLCKEQFSDVNALVRHKESHVISGYVSSDIERCLYKCTTCGQSFMLKRLLLEHEKTHASDGPGQCDICKKMFIEKDELTEHMKTHAVKAPNKCNYCGKVFLAQYSLKRHECPQKTFAYLPNATEPMPNYSSLSFECECNLCGETFADKPSLHIHMKAHSGSAKDKGFKCTLCKEQFSDVNALVRHKESHVISGYVSSDIERCLYKCTTCGQSFMLKRLLLEHEKTHASDGPGQCDICKKMFIEKEELTEHMKTHAVKAPNKCNYCGKVFLAQYSLKRHECPQKTFADLPNATEPMPNYSSLSFECDVCKLMFEHEAELKEHLLTHGIVKQEVTDTDKTKEDEESVSDKDEDTHVEDKPYTCASCGEKFSDEEDFICHICNTYGDNMSADCDVMMVRGLPPSGEKTYMCITCDKVFPRKQLLVIHERKHTGETPYKCSTCGKGFAAKNSLTKHEMIHTGEKPCVCSVCGKAFGRSGTLTVHMRLHTGEKPYKCSMCEEGFTRRQLLIIHERKHTGEKPYKCETCGKGFITRNTLNKHEMTHTGERPCVCTICGKSFARTSTLNIHMRTHTGETPYKCPKCEKAFVNSVGLKYHMTTHTIEKGHELAHGKDEEKAEKTSLVKQENSLSGGKSFDCSMCDKTFTEKKEIDES